MMTDSGFYLCFSSLVVRSDEAFFRFHIKIKQTEFCSSYYYYYYYNSHVASVAVNS